MKKIKKTLAYSFGAFIAFLFSKSTALAQAVPMYGVQPEYGVGFYEESTLWEKVLSIVLSPVFIVIIVALALISGTIIFIKRRRKNVK